MNAYHQHTETVTIAAAAAISGSFLLYGYRIAAVVDPATWTAADISFEIDASGSGTFVKVVDNAGALVKITGVSTTVSEYHFPPDIGSVLVGERAQIVSTNTASEVDINQDAARTIIVVLAPLTAGD